MTLIPAQAGAQALYTVVAGDNLSKVGEANGMSWQEVHAKNPTIANPNLIFPGQVLNLDKEVAPAAAPVTPVVQVVAQPSGDKYGLMAQAGIPESDHKYVDYIISKESSWNHSVWNKGGSGAYGLCQSMPASKMASAGSDYATNPVTQLKWCDSYAKGRYGSWAGAFAAWQRQNWW